jgi:type III pantothenate kinase
MEMAAVSELLLVLDVGNTNTVVGLFQGTELVSRWRLSTHADRTADEVGMWLRQLLDWQGVDPAELVGVAVGSVVPPIDPWLREGIGRYLGIAPFFVEPGIRTGMPLRVDAPQELGADRLCDAVAAHEFYGGPCVVVDFGTAVTWEVVSEAGEYLGGAIAPGPGVTADALASRTAEAAEGRDRAAAAGHRQGTVDSISPACSTATWAWWRRDRRILAELGMRGHRHRGLPRTSRSTPTSSAHRARPHPARPRLLWGRNHPRQP